MPSRTLAPSTDSYQPSSGEQRVLAVLATGVTLKTAARQLGLSDRTVRRRVRNVCDQLGCNTTIEAVTWAVKRELI